jgi:hypothetical protein
VPVFPSSSQNYHSPKKTSPPAPFSAKEIQVQIAAQFAKESLVLVDQYARKAPATENGTGREKQSQIELFDSLKNALTSFKIALDDQLLDPETAIDMTANCILKFMNQHSRATNRAKRVH